MALTYDAFLEPLGNYIDLPAPLAAFVDRVKALETLLDQDQPKRPVEPEWNAPDSAFTAYLVAQQRVETYKAARKKWYAEYDVRTGGPGQPRLKPHALIMNTHEDLISLINERMTAIRSEAKPIDNFGIDYASAIRYGSDKQKAAGNKLASLSQEWAFLGSRYVELLTSVSWERDWTQIQLADTQEIVTTGGSANNIVAHLRTQGVRGRVDLSDPELIWSNPGHIPSSLTAASGGIPALTDIAHIPEEAGFRLDTVGGAINRARHKRAEELIAVEERHQHEGRVFPSDISAAIRQCVAKHGDYEF